MSEDEVVQALLHAFDARADLRVQFREAYRAGAAAREASIVAEAVDTANGVVLDGTHSVDYWCGFRDALECFARNIAAGAHRTARSTPSGEGR